MRAPRPEHADEPRNTDLVHRDRGDSPTERDDAFGTGTRLGRVHTAFGFLGRDRRTGTHEPEAPQDATLERHPARSRSHRGQELHEYVSV